jgi:hypothetical protein
MRWLDAPPNRCARPARPNRHRLAGTRAAVGRPFPRADRFRIPPGTGRKPPSHGSAGPPSWRAPWACPPPSDPRYRRRWLATTGSGRPSCAAAAWRRPRPPPAIPSPPSDPWPARWPGRWRTCCFPNPSPAAWARSCRRASSCSGPPGPLCIRRFPWRWGLRCHRSDRVAHVPARWAYPHATDAGWDRWPAAPAIPKVLGVAMRGEGL